MQMQAAIQQAIDGKDFTGEQMTAVMNQIMTGEATPSQIGGFLVALRLKGETVDEIASAAGVMRNLAARVELDLPNLVDTCGTGGDGAKVFNVSTAGAFVAAAAGCHVAKHGNRSVSSKTGSADVLEAAGVNLALNADQVGQCVRELGVGFMFAPNHHAAMKYAIGPRKEMGVRTIFNVLGPLTNPAYAPHQVVGVFSEVLLDIYANVLKQLGSKHVLVVHADDGLDELSIATTTQVCELKDGEIKRYSVTPEELGLTRHDLSAIQVDSAEESLAMIQDAFNGGQTAAADMIALNSGAAIYAAGKADSLQDGISKAKEILNNGEAAKKLQALVDLSKSLG